MDTRDVFILLLKWQAKRQFCYYNYLSFAWTCQRTSTTGGLLRAWVDLMVDSSSRGDEMLSAAAIISYNQRTHSYKKIP